jgi:hypothetical protein
VGSYVALATDPYANVHYRLYIKSGIVAFGNWYAIFVVSFGFEANLFVFHLPEFRLTFNIFRWIALFKLLN